MKKTLKIIIFSIVAAVIIVSALYLAGSDDRKAGSADLKALSPKKTAEASPGGLYLISWNTGYLYKGKAWAQNGTEERIAADPSLITGFIEKQQPDLVLLQECSESEAEALDSGLETYSVWFAGGQAGSRFKALMEKRKNPEGLALLSRLRLSGTSAEYLPGPYTERKPRNRSITRAELPGSSGGEKWIIINAGINSGPDDSERQAFVDALAELLSPETSSRALVLCGDFSAFPEDEIAGFKNRMPAGFRMFRTENAPDGRDRSMPWSRLESKTWNRVLLVVSDAVEVRRIYVHDMKFEYTPGNPVSFLLSLK